MAFPQICLERKDNANELPTSAVNLNGPNLVVANKIVCFTSSFSTPVFAWRPITATDKRVLGSCVPKALPSSQLDFENFPWPRLLCLFTHVNWIGTSLTSKSTQDVLSKRACVHFWMLNGIWSANNRSNELRSRYGPSGSKSERQASPWLRWLFW